MMRADLLGAIGRGEHDAIRSGPWGAVWEVLATRWAPRQTCPLGELRPYAQALGDAPVADVLAAIDEATGTWRPSAGEVLAALRRLRGENERVDVGRGRDLSSTEDALRAAAQAHMAGEPECSCGFHHPSWSRDNHWVLRCRRCGGLEPGQVAYGLVAA
jgi:hypothetical protein